MKHVTIDARMIGNAGIGRFLRQVVFGIVQDRRFRLTLLGESDALGDLATQNGRVRIVDCKAPLYSLREQLELPTNIPRCDLLYVPHYVIPLLYRGPLVVAVNDVIHLERRDFVRGLFGRWYARAMITSAVWRARRVITLSNYSRDRLVALVKAPSDKIEVVYPSIDSGFLRPIAASALAAIRERYGLQVPYLLFVGSAKVHKNLASLILALDLVRKRGSQYHLAIVGQFAGIRSNIALLRQLVAERGVSPFVRFLGVVPDDDLPAVYAGAELFVFPSLAEGFGLPPLEAMACGTPVLAARASSVPEVCGDAADYYAPPDSPAALAEAILALEGDPSRRARLQALGRDRVRRLSASDSTAQVLDLLYKA